MKKRLLLMIIFLSIIFNIGTIVNADSSIQFREGNYVKPNVYIRKVLGTQRDYMQIRMIQNVATGQHAYCVQPFIKIKPNVDYNHTSGIENANNVMPGIDWNRVVLISHYGYGYGSHTQTYWYGVTQYMIWKVVHPGIQLWFADSLADAKNGVLNDSKYDAEQAEINALVDNHLKTPSFNINENLVIGRTYSFNDNNNVLSGFDVVGQTNCQAWKDGNTLYITPTAVGIVSVDLQKGSDNVNLFFRDDAQNVIYAGDSAVKANVTAKSVGGKINLSKVDSETGAVAQGDAILKGAVYAVYNSVGNEIARLTIGDDLTAKTDYLDLGTYTIKEVGAPNGYNLSNETYTVTITADNLNPVVQVKDNVIKGNLEILKKLESTDYDSEINLSGAQFKITLKSDTTKVYYTN